MNKNEIEQFEIEQKDFGTAVVLNNFLVTKLTNFLHKELNITDVKIKYNKNLEKTK